MYTPCKPKFYHIKVGLKGSKLYRRVFVMDKIFLELQLDLIETGHSNSCKIACVISEDSAGHCMVSQRYKASSGSDVPWLIYILQIKKQNKK